MTMKNLLLSLFLLSTITFFSSCEKESAGSDNPYDTWTSTPRGPVIKDLPMDPNSIEGLHKNIFKPTCANSGCHDGNFEPDFRSIESTYNSLLYRDATNYDPTNLQIEKRVLPGDAANSMLLHRIKTFIPGTQGQMPLTTDPGSDWAAKKNEYIQNITKWINDGAKDQFGKSALSLDFPPQLGGLMVFADGSSTPLPHIGLNPIEIPSGINSIKIMVSFIDDKTPTNQLGATTFNFSLNPYEYTNPEATMTTESTPFITKGILGKDVEYWHSISLPVSTFKAVAKDVVWIRTQTTDNINAALFIPATSAAFNTKKYCALIIR
jgi:hypothetical protein